VANLLPNLLHDLKQRCSYLEATLNALTGLPGSVDAYRLKMVKLLQRARTNIENLSTDPTLLVPKLAKRHLSSYKRLAELTSTMEWGPVAALRRFSAPEDTLMAHMAERVCKELGYPFTPPLCVAGGFGHYWTDPSLDLIVAPASEPFHLLGISDLYHELGHIITLRKKTEFETPLLKVVASHFAAEVKRARQNSRPPAFIARLKELSGNWKTWLIEFLADMIATYLTGPAYGWANVRLCMNLHEDVYEATDTHPADAARTGAIELVLEALGATTEAGSIRQFWADFVSLTGKKAPQEFDIEFPDSLLRKIRDVVIQECTNLKLVPFGQQPQGGSGVNITRLLTDAWAKFHQDPSTFSAWEARQIVAIRQELGI
jgi:hypothetical protein